MHNVIEGSREKSHNTLYLQWFIPGLSPGTSLIPALCNLFLLLDRDTQLESYASPIRVHWPSPSTPS